MRKVGVPNIVVDRYRFHEMLDSPTEVGFWPKGMVMVLSMDFAKKPEVLKSLASTRWDLVVANEAHLFGGARLDTLRQVGASAKRIILATLPDLEPPDAFKIEDTMIIEKRRDQIVGHDGLLLDTMPRPVLHEISFSLTPAELSLLEKVKSLCQILRSETQLESWQAKYLLHTLESSPAALEKALQRFVERLEGNELEAPSGTFEEEASGDRPTGQLSHPNAERATELAKHALQEIEVINKDSKLDAFGELLNSLKEKKAQSRRICVLTEHLGTLYYLATEIEDRGRKYGVLHGGMGTKDRNRAMTLFLSEAEVLVATAAVITEGQYLEG